MKESRGAPTLMNCGSTGSLTGGLSTDRWAMATRKMMGEGRMCASQYRRVRVGAGQSVAGTTFLP
ncbi:unnamed protein product [Chondrus crispus]|uniref:Uncharacterized protein n=1 Tax=Chondrus crispus TaxID=2769 RepID=R7Q183_CHOCR|nr:unnamed protein product [Chondrus crispus]CDF32382.1 unnamed protein product [Chondrus crispus]|eukprot:XP_005712047.1 unnamed protein product [Chondrus crispus]